MAFTQLLCVDQEAAEALRRANAELPNLGGNYDPLMAKLREMLELNRNNQAGDRTSDMGSLADKRPRSDAGSDNPRPTSTPRLTREEQQQTNADGKVNK